jgi:hypothetical protein
VNTPAQTKLKYLTFPYTHSAFFVLFKTFSTTTCISAIFIYTQSVLVAFIAYSVFTFVLVCAREKEHHYTSRSAGLEIGGTPLSNLGKNSQVVTNLQQTCSNAVPTTYQQDVFALLVPMQLVDKLSTAC